MHPIVHGFFRREIAPAVTLVSRFTTRTSGATSARSPANASPHGHAKPTGQGIGPFAASASLNVSPGVGDDGFAQRGIDMTRKYLVDAATRHHIAAEEQIPRHTTSVRLNGPCVAGDQ